MNKNDILHVTRRGGKIIESFTIWDVESFSSKSVGALIEIYSSQNELRNAIQTIAKFHYNKYFDYRDFLIYRVWSKDDGFNYGLFVYYSTLQLEHSCYSASYFNGFLKGKNSLGRIQKKRRRKNKRKNFNKSIDSAIEYL